MIRSFIFTVLFIISSTLAIPSVVYKFTNGPVYENAKIQPPDGAFVIRKYWPTWWLSTRPGCDGPGINITAKFSRVESYFRGANRRRQVFAVTQPQLVRFRNRPGKSCEEEVSELMYVPFDPSVRPASPHDRVLILIDTPALRLIVKRYLNGGVEWDKEKCKEAAALFKQELVQRKINFSREYFVCARHLLPNRKVKFEVGFQKIPKQEVNQDDQEDNENSKVDHHDHD